MLSDSTEVVFGRPRGVSATPGTVEKKLVFYQPGDHPCPLRQWHYYDGRYHRYASRRGKVPRDRHSAVDQYIGGVREATDAGMRRRWDS